MPKLVIRDFLESDIPAQDAYFRGAGDAYLLRLGVNPELMRGPSTDLETFRQRQLIPVQDRSIHGFAFDIDGKIAGNMTFKQIKFGESSDAHGHIYDEQIRRSGLGTKAFAIGFDRAFKTWNLKMIFCEPSAGNPAPNALLQSLGLKIVATYDTPADGILLPRTVNRYEIHREWFYEVLLPRT